MHGGYIKWHRKIQKHWLNEPRVYSRYEAWLDMLMEARPFRTVIKVTTPTGALVSCGYGQVVRSKIEWGDRWLWNESKVRRFLERLLNERMINELIVGNSTMITICNYETYQGNRRTRDEPTDEPATNPRRTRDEPSARNKEEEESKESKELLANSPPRARDLIWDAVAQMFFGGKVEEPDCAHVGKVVKVLKGHGATPQDIRARAALYRKQWPNVKLTMDALAKHYGQLLPDRNQANREVDQTNTYLLEQARLDEEVRRERERKQA